MKTLDGDGELFELNEFTSMVRSGGICPDDGDGYWATSKMESDMLVWEIKRPDFATHVKWYSK